MNKKFILSLLFAPMIVGFSLASYAATETTTETITLVNKTTDTLILGNINSLAQDERITVDNKTIPPGGQATITSVSTTGYHQYHQIEGTLPIKAVNNMTGAQNQNLFFFDDQGFGFSQAPVNEFGRNDQLQGKMTSSTGGTDLFYSLQRANADIDVTLNK